ncbi:hypothetical protein N0V88_008016 [Collariella sp. IMI 366227]|nr:hypothetical protein N0V88_008016 [Collariella sp. IMI 366227]
MDLETRRQVEYALLEQDKLIGASVITLAKNLYTTDVRFILELLQNANDNRFVQAKQASQIPYIAFRYHPDQIVVDCNEDGFEEADLRAICSVGKSSKQGAQGYIGENGIGFKSVFKVTSKVHIRSGHYSFRFCHRPRDSSMGMISPEWEDSSEELTGPLTRMALFLRDDGDRDEKVSRRKNILEQLDALQPAMLLFLKNLRRIEIRRFDASGNKVVFITKTISAGESPNRAVLQTERLDCGQEELKSFRQQYHVTKNKVSGLTKSENRTYTQAEQETKAYEKAEIVLAFPTSNQSEPAIDPQELFAFLPVRRVGFNFIIHSDFVTNANREDIVTSSLRNNALLDGIAATFISAVEQMVQHSDLRYTWIRYLPDSDTEKIDPFWRNLVENIKVKLRIARFLLPHSSQELGSMETLRRTASVKPPLLNNDKNPLFDDLNGQDAIYLSLNYQARDFQLLELYGLQVVNIEQLIRRAKSDLAKEKSKMRQSDTDEMWLYKFIGVREHLRLIHRDGLRLSDELVYIRDKLPKEFLSFFRLLWPYEGNLLHSKPILLYELRAAQVLCQDGNLYQLLDTFIPLPRLKELISRFLDEGEQLPFLLLRSNLSGEKDKRWGFLNTLGLGSNENFQFYEAILKVIVQVNPGGCVKRMSRVIEIGTEIHCKVNAAHHYADVEKFFLELLSVNTLDITMVYDELISADTRGLTPERVKDLLWSLNSLFPTDQLRKDQSPKRLFQDPNLEELFRPQVKIMDFTLSEVHKLEPLLKWGRLENRFLSVLVEEKSVLDSGEKHAVSEPKFDIKSKAHALLRIAIHFNSPRITDNGQAFYGLLCSCQTWETTGISSELHLTMNGEVFKVKIEHSDVHINEAADLLKIYIPHNEVTQDVCIQHALPQKLVEEGIIEVDVPNMDLETDKGTSGVLTSILISKGHLPSARWQGKTPNYYIEVKASTLDCNTQFFVTQFFVSGYQYQKMKEVTLKDDTAYIIFRVYNMYTRDINVRLYMDPTQLEQEGKLRFWTDEYKVTRV